MSRKILDSGLFPIYSHAKFEGHPNEQSVQYPSSFNIEGDRR